MPSNKRTPSNFVTIVNEATLSGFYFLHDHPQQFELMEDGTLVHRSSFPLQWRQAHSMAKLIWPANSPYLNPVENLRKIVKDLLWHHPRPKYKEKMAKIIQSNEIQYIWSNSKL